MFIFFCCKSTVLVGCFLIVVVSLQRVGSKLFFDKRDDSEFGEFGFIVYLCNLISL